MGIMGNTLTIGMGIMGVTLTIGMGIMGVTLTELYAQLFRSSTVQ